MELTKEEIKNIIALINIAPIKGVEATTVAILQQKLTKMLNDEDVQATPDGDTK